ncbi:MAG: PAS domain-containing sensor histidine kinase, partial [Nitrospirae bacterium]
MGGLEADSAFLTRVLDSIEDAVAVVDRDFTILWANRAYRDSATPHEGRVEGARCYRVSHARDNPCGTREAGGEACDCPVAAAFAEGRPQRAAHVHQDADGRQIHVEVKAYPVRDAAGAVVAVLEVIRDITRQVELEAELRHAQKMEAVGVLVGGVAHDFNNVLTAITGYAELLQVELPAATPARLAADEILAAAERATRLTRSLLAFSHKVEAEFAVLEVNGVVLAVEKLLRRLVGEDVALELRLAEGPIHLHG